MILENGVIRTLDPSLPVVRSLAIAGDRVVGGVGTHETALPGPERVDLGGRCVLPGFTDSHVHFPTWAVAQDEVRLEDTRSLDEALARVRDALPGSKGTWLRGRGWRSGDWSPAVEPTKEALDEIVSDRPVALLARDSHSLWLNSAALARRERRPRRCPAASSSWTSAASRPACSARSPAGTSATPTSTSRTTSTWRRCAPGVRLAASRGVTAVHDKDGWIGALRFWQRLEAEGSLTLRVWQSLPAEKADELADVDVRSGLGGPLLRLGYLKAFMDGTLGSQTARMLDGSGVEITSREELVRADPRRRACRLSFGRPRDRRPRQPRGARRLRGDA